MDHPDRNRWCIPMNGDFHFVAHVVAALDALYFLPFTAWIATALGFDQVIKRDDDNVTNFKHYDHFYLLMTTAIVNVLCEEVDHGLLAFPSVLLEQVKHDKGMSSMSKLLVLLNLFYF